MLLTRLIQAYNVAMGKDSLHRSGRPLLEQHSHQFGREILAGANGKQYASRLSDRHRRYARPSLATMIALRFHAENGNYEIQLQYQERHFTLRKSQEHTDYILFTRPS